MEANDEAKSVLESRAVDGRGIGRVRVGKRGRGFEWVERDREMIISSVKIDLAVEIDVMKHSHNP